MASVIITHRKVSGKPAGTDSTRIYGTAWDDTHAVTGLENVDNTSDANKPVSIAQAAAIAAQMAIIALKANLAGGNSFAGNQAISGTFGVSGDIAINTNKFTVAASSGNTAIAGALTVNSAAASTSTTTGALVTAGGAGITGAANIGGVVSSLGGFSSPAVTQQFGPGGTAAGIAAQIILNGSSGNNSGGGMRFQRNGVNLFAFGTSAGILGGGTSPAGDDFVVYSYVSGAGATAAINIQSATGAVQVQSSFGTASPSTKTGNYTVGNNDGSLILNGVASITLTLPSAASFPGRWLHLKNIAAFSVVSSAANVVPQAGGAAGTAILAATAGKWAALQSDGVSSWQIMMSN
jgi:hypothetical protein